VAEHGVAIVMTLSHNIRRAYNRVREGNFMLDGLLGITPAGKTVGIVRTGKIGLATARIFAGFGCTVLGSDPVPSPAFPGTMVELPQLLARAHIVTLHSRLLPATCHMINARTLALMERGAMLVNTSRGGLIDTDAFIAALKSRQLGHLAIDVHEQEGALFFDDHSSDIIDDDVFQRLMTFPNVLVTGHQGFFTVDALREISAVTLRTSPTLLTERPATTF
jgi:D-lactate dehydrogenase